MSARNSRVTYGLLMVAAFLSVLGLLGCRASEADYPTKPVTMVVYVSPGGQLDLFGREAARQVEKMLKVPMPVENRAGGGGLTALSYIKSQPADGYNIAMATVSLLYAMAAPDSPVAVTDFDWIIRQNTEPFLLAVKGDGQFKTLEDLVRVAKANPGKVKMGGTGTGGIQDGIALRFSTLAGIQTTWVPFDSGKDASVATLGGHLDAFIATPSTPRPLLQDGSLRGLAITSEKRSEFMLNLPTFKEQGFDVVESQWRGVVVKKGTPANVEVKLHDSFKQLMDTPEWKEYNTKNWVSDYYLGTEALGKEAAKGVEDARTLLKQLGAIK